MKVKELLAHLEHHYEPDDEIIVTWFDQSHTSLFIEYYESMDRDLVSKAWKEIVNEGQESLNHLLEFRAFVYDLSDEYLEKIQELQEGDN
jgi:hypothetical protein